MPFRLCLSLLAVLAGLVGQTSPIPPRAHPVPVLGKTVVRSESAKALLLGDHRFTLQWIAFTNKAGRVYIEDHAGQFYLKGEQRAPKAGDYAKIEGVVTELDEKTFRFAGRIEMQVSHLAGGKPCVREGKDFVFLIKGPRKFWRMQQMDNPCDEATDYFDIHF